MIHFREGKNMIYNITFKCANKKICTMVCEPENIKGIKPNYNFIFKLREKRG